LKSHSLKFRHRGRIERPYYRRTSAQSRNVRGTQADSAPQSETANAGPLRILVVDDERRIRKLLGMGLKTQSYELLEAPDRQTSLKLLLQNPDLIILDLGLPDDGLELLREIRDRNEMFPIIVLSDRDHQTIKAQALDLGAKDYIPKPFAMDELLVRIRAVLCNQQHAGGGRPMLETERL